jgi:hypothetical protein
MVTVFGDAGKTGTGTEVVKQGLVAGHESTAVVRISAARRCRARTARRGDDRRDRFGVRGGGRHRARGRAGEPAR